MDCKEVFLQIYGEHIHREGADALLDYLEHILSRFHQAQLVTGQVGLTLRIAAVFHGVGQVSVDLLLSLHLLLGGGQIGLGGLELAAHGQQPGGLADEQRQDDEFGQKGCFLEFHG